MNCSNYLYRITNIKNNKFYVGSTSNLNVRLRRHWYDLSRNNHHCKHFQDEYNLFGREVFEVSSLEFNTLDEAREAEQLELDLRMADPLMLNIGKGVKGGDNLSKNPDKDDVVSRIKGTLVDRYKGMTKEDLILRFGQSGVLNGMYGRTHTEEVRAKISESSKGNTNSKGKIRGNSSRNNISEGAKKRVASEDYVNPFEGKHHSTETKELLSAKNKGKLPPNVKSVIAAGVHYISATEAARELGVCAETIRFRIKSKYFTDYRYPT